jgi:hypothetical protein
MRGRLHLDQWHNGSVLHRGFFPETALGETPSGECRRHVAGTLSGAVKQKPSGTASLQPRQDVQAMAPSMLIRTRAYRTDKAMQIRGSGEMT